MASQLLPKLRVYIPLRQRRIPKYPLYVDGNPQLRVFMPLFWMKLMRNEKVKSPENHVMFEVHPQMTNYDIKNYLEKIYGVNVLSVNSKLKKGPEIKAFGYDMGHEDHQRFAYVKLEEKFVFPDIFKETKTQESKSMDEFSKMEKTIAKERKKHWDKETIPAWFR